MYHMLTSFIADQCAELFDFNNHAYRRFVETLKVKNSSAFATLRRNIDMSLRTLLTPMVFYPLERWESGHGNSEKPGRMGQMEEVMFRY